MKSICYVVPYFGKLPGKAFELWLLSCAANPTVNWIIFTDDRSGYNYPSNVKVYYCSFDELRERFQTHYDFPIVLDRGWKLCDYKIAYGEIFAKELEGYDFWGNCDIDLMFGNIRKYYTEELLEKYDKIGYLAHSTLYRNTPEVNTRYRLEIDGLMNYRTAFSESEGHAFDEVGIEAIYNHLGIEYYKKVDFANLTKYEKKFHLGNLPDSEEYKNNRQVFTWKNGTLLRHYLSGGSLYEEEFLYIHFWCRPMSYKISAAKADSEYLIYSDVVSDKPFLITPGLVSKKGTSHPIAFYAKSIWKNRHKLTIKRIIFNIKGALGK